MMASFCNIVLTLTNYKQNQGLNVRVNYIVVLIGIFFIPSFCISQERTLDYYLQAGFSNSPVLKDLGNQVKQNSADSLIARAGFMPQVGLTGYMIYAPVINGYGYSEVITNGQNLTGIVNVSQPFFNKKTRDAEYEKYGIRNKALENEVKINRNNLEKEITGQYLDACAISLEIDFSKDLLATLNEEAEILRKLVESGIYKQTDYLSLRIEIASLQRQQKDLRVQFGKELSTLNILCGIRDTAAYRLVLPELKESITQPPDGSPFIQRFRLDSLRINNERTLIGRKYKPNFNWFSDAGLINNEPRYIYQNFGLSLGLSLTLPIYDGNQRKLNFTKLKSEEETRKNYEDYFRLQYDMQLIQLRDELQKTKQIIEDTEGQVGLCTSLISGDRALLNSGSIPITDYVIALKNLVEASQVQVHYQVRALQIINELNFWKRQ